MPSAKVERRPLRPVVDDATGATEESSTLFGRLTAVLSGDVFVNLTVVIALAIGFIHGWLKIRYRSPFTTFLFDIALFVALGVVFLRAGSLRRFFPEGKTAAALLGFYGLCAAYLPVALIPGMPPFLVALSTLRVWLFGTFLYGLGYQIIRSRSQLHGYFLLMLIFSVATAIYGIRQSDEEVLQMMKEDQYFARRYRGQGYVDSEGDYHVRRFSTFVSSGAFGATMATAMIFGGALFLAPKARRLEQVLVAASMVPIGYGMLLSGARSASITAVVGFATLLVFRRKWTLGLVLISVLGVGAVLAAQATGGGVVDRLATLNFASIFYRFWWPTSMGLDYMSTHPLGGGIGKTGAAPTFIKYMNDYWDYYSPDGDLGRLMVEFGILGLIFFGRLAWASAQSMYIAVRDTEKSPSAMLVLASATNLWISILFVGVGSPFVGIPTGVLVWFFVGAAQRLSEIERLALPAAAVEAETVPAGAGSHRGGVTKPGAGAAEEAVAPSRRYLYREPGLASERESRQPRLLLKDSEPASVGDGAGAAGTEVAAVPEPPRKVFLYANTKAGGRRTGTKK